MAWWLGRKGYVPRVDALGVWHIFPCYFPFLSEPATFCLIFSLAIEWQMLGWVGWEWVSGRDPSCNNAQELVDRHPSALWSLQLKHFLILSPSVPQWGWAPVALGCYLTVNTPFTDCLPIPLSLSYSFNSLVTIPPKRLALMSLSHCWLPEGCNQRQWLTEDYIQPQANLSTSVRTFIFGRDCLLLSKLRKTTRNYSVCIWFTLLFQNVEILSSKPDPLGDCEIYGHCCGGLFFPTLLIIWPLIKVSCFQGLGP